MARLHVIRLRGPWELEALPHDSAVADQPKPIEPPSRRRVSVPGDRDEHLGHDFVGTARYTRRFNRPTNLDPHERVWLAIDGASHQAVITLNGHAVGQAEGCQTLWRFDITPLLEDHNLLAIDVSLPPEVAVHAARRGPHSDLAGGLTGEVRLEIG